jgi:hypothetical protein
MLQKSSTQKGFCVEDLYIFLLERHLKQAEGVDYQHLPLGDFFCYFFLCVEDCVESEVIRNPYKFDYLSSVRDNHGFISLCF